MHFPTVFAFSQSKGILLIKLSFNFSIQNKALNQCCSHLFSKSLNLILIPLIISPRVRLLKAAALHPSQTNKNTTEIYKHVYLLITQKSNRLYNFYRTKQIFEFIFYLKITEKKAGLIDSELAILLKLLLLVLRTAVGMSQTTQTRL